MCCCFEVGFEVWSSGLIVPSKVEIGLNGFIPYMRCWDLRMVSE